ncbi:hypothetical protein CF326_g1809 [Tilletia indica]|nr:hypothetical protein CF326_g1809 [Tilletia indica]
MKKFFSRFSTGPSTVAAGSSPTIGGGDSTTPGSPSTRKDPSTPQGSPGNNVRSIAARFESIHSPPAGSSSGGGFLQPSSSAVSNNNQDILTPSSSILPALQTIGVASTSGLPPPPPSKDRRQQQQQQQRSADSPLSPTQNLPSVILNGGAGGSGGGGRRTKDARDASGGSSAANSSSTSNAPPHPIKTVAFAPSPKKAVRSPILLQQESLVSASPLLATPPNTQFSFPTASGQNGNGHHGGGGGGGGSGSGMASDSSDTDLRSFAKPTAASLARAAFRSGSPQLSTASAGASSSLYSKRISLPSRSLVDGREGSVSWTSTGARQVGGPSWSEMTEDDLVMNLGPRERTRQEVLWEIVASEERYVHELQRTQQFYLEALLHPYRFSTKELPLPPNSPPPVGTTNTSSSSASSGAGAGAASGMGNGNGDGVLFAGTKLTETVPEHPVELPIAARWMNTSSGANNGSSTTGGGGAGAAAASSSSRAPPSTAAIIQSSYRPLPGRRSSTGSPRLPGAALPSTGPSSSSGPRTPSGGGGQPSSSSNKPTRSSTFDSLAQASSSSSPSSSSPMTNSNQQPHPLSRSEDVNHSSSSSSNRKSSSQSRSSKRTSLGATASAAFKSKMPQFPTFPGSSQGRRAPDPLEVLLPVSLPAPVRIVLETMSEGLLHEHSLLSDALKNRYQEQWPLVRSLADVFLKHSFLLQHYATYVCHLERALEYLEEAALMERAMRGKRIRKEKMTQTVAVGRAIAALEIIAAERGEPGLALFISKPFQRLLKYPLLFQNLLFHTDPSTYEFESTVGMVVEVEHIVRSIEDEKVSAEERDRTRDCFARIDGINDKGVLKPKADRTLIEEKPLYDEGPRRALSESRTENVGQNEAVTSEFTSGPGRTGDNGNGNGPEGPSASLRAMLKSKRSFRRLSDFLSPGPGGSGGNGDGEKGGGGNGGGSAGGTANGSPGGSAPTKAPNLGSKRDLWVIRFSDVELRCQRTGTTTLPMVSSAALRPEGSGPPGASGSGGTNGGSAGQQQQQQEDEVPDFASRAQYSKERLRALRNTTLRAKTRNLYKFIAVQSWKTAAPSAAAAAYAARRAEGLARAIQEVEAEDESEGSEESDEDEGGGQGLLIREEEDGDEEDGPTDSEESGDEEFGAGAVGGSAGAGTAGAGGNQERFVREAKLSFSYWGDDRVEPRPSATYSTNSNKSPALSSVAAFRAAMQQSAQANANGNGNGPHSSSGSSTAGGGGGVSGRGDLSHLNSGGSTPNLRSLSPSKRLAAENVVAGSHATPRVQKFGNRLRTVPPSTAQSAESASSSTHGHGPQESSMGSSNATGGTTSGRISGTHHSQFGGGGASSRASTSTSVAGGTAHKSGRVSNTSSYR